MEAMKQIIRLTEAETIGEMDGAMMDAHSAINEMHLEKLRELEAKVEGRLGVKSQTFGSSPMVAREDPQDEAFPRPRRPVRDNPQA